MVRAGATTWPARAPTLAVEARVLLTAAAPPLQDRSHMSEPWTRVRRHLRSLAPWLVAALVLGYVLSGVSGSALASALAQVSPWRFALVVIGLTVGALVADSLAVWTALGSTSPGSALPYRDVLLVRCASSLLALLNYGAGQGGVVYFLYRRHRVPVEAGTGAVLLASVAFLVVLALASGLGLLAGAVPDRPELRLVAWGAVAITPVYIALVAIRPRALVRRRLLRHLLAARAGVLGRVIVARAIHLAVLITGHWLAMRLFGIAVPPASALLQLPALFLVTALPISPAGLGTTQAAAITLFGVYAGGATEAARHSTVLAYSLSCHVAGVALLAAIGLVCWRRLARAPEAAESPPEPGANNQRSESPEPCKQ